MSKIYDIFKKRKSQKSGDPSDTVNEHSDTDKIPLALGIPKQITWKHRLIFIASLLLIFAIIAMIVTLSANPVNRTKKNVDSALVISSSELIAAYSDPANADILYKNKYLKVSGIKWLGYSADGNQNFHVWSGAENVNLHSKIFDISCSFPNTKYYRDLSPYYGKIFNLTVVGKCIGVSNGHIKMIDCIIITDLE